MLGDDFNRRGQGEEDDKRRGTERLVKMEKSRLEREFNLIDGGVRELFETPLGVT